MDESHTASALLRHTIYLADHASQEAEACEVPVLSIETAHSVMPPRRPCPVSRLLVALTICIANMQGSPLSLNQH